MAQPPSSPKIGALSPALPMPAHPPQGALEGMSFSAALRLGARQRTAGTTVGLLGALLFHSALGLPAAMSSFQAAQFARSVFVETRARATATVDIDLQPPAPEPPPVELPPPAPTVAAPEPWPQSTTTNRPSSAVAQPHNGAPPPPPAAAQAGQVLAAASDPDEPVDLTGNTFVVGNAATYAGGITASSGTSKSAVYDRAASPTGVVGGTGPKATATVYNGPDLSRGAGVTSTDWGQAPFPPEADVEQINFMRVTVVVQVGPDGRPRSATAINDPGFGFGRVARQYALQHTYNAALDRSGKPIAQSLTVTIKFQR
ncbi:MAG TPA: hypothetical protein VL137_10655 [Polyangiaceae bacterium]|nr:hypothetical protein [Polyangiaceae bacterium]